MKLIIAEKPSVGKDIANIVGANEKKNGYFEGNGYYISWAFGHLVELAAPKKYNPDYYKVENLPLIPNPFVLELKDDAGVRKQFKVLKELINKSSTIINGADAGREGELIFRYLYILTGIKNKILKRLWISDLTEETIKKGLNNLEDAAKFDNLYYSAKARSESDWLVGLNGSIATTKIYNKGLISVGRVQTPTLNLIVSRYLDKKNHVKEALFTPKITVSIKDKLIEFTHSKSYKENITSNKILDKISNQELIYSESTTQSKNPNNLFDLTTLQRYMNEKHSFTSKKTLSVTQALYEKHKLLSYPRTDSQHLPTTMTNEVQVIFNKLKNVNLKGKSIDNYLGVLTKNIPNNTCFNNSKISDHYAIIPTGLVPNYSKLSEDETKLYNSVLAQFTSKFLNPFKFYKTVYSIGKEDYLFTISGIKIIENGYLEVLDVAEKKDTVLPEVSENELYSVTKKEIIESETKPKPLHTESSLLLAMETAGKVIKNAEMRDAMKERGLGTPATRDSIIETLITRSYIIREKKSLVPTDLGLSLIDTLKDFSIIDAELTGEWEYKLKLIEENKYDYKVFMNEIIESTKSLTSDILKLQGKVDYTDTKKEVEGVNCPKCKGKLKQSAKSFYCENTPKKECDFIIYKTIAGKKLNEKIIKELINNGKTKSKIKGFKSKINKPFEAYLVLKEGKISFEFDKK